MIEEKQILIIVDHLDSVIEGGGARTSIFNFLLFFSAHLNLTYLSVEYLNNFSATHSKPSGLEYVRANYPNSFTELIRKLSTFCIRNKESVIYLNSFYSKTGTFIPLLLVRFLGIFVKTPKMVLAPRGGVSKGALSVRKYRKIIYLKTLLYLGFFKNVRFHAVTKIEKEDICRILGKSYISQCFEAANLVNAPQRFEFSKKLSPSGRLRIGFLF